MTPANRDKAPEHPEKLAEEVEYLAAEVKLLAINLAIALAKIESREKVFGQLEARFTELVKRANDTSLQVSQVIKVFRNSHRMSAGLPASTEIIQIRGAYDSIEAKLNHVFKLSRDMERTISKIKQQQQVGG